MRSLPSVKCEWSVYQRQAVAVGVGRVSLGTRKQDSNSSESTKSHQAPSSSECCPMVPVPAELLSPELRENKHACFKKQILNCLCTHPGGNHANHTIHDGVNLILTCSMWMQLHGCTESQYQKKHSSSVTVYDILLLLHV